MYRYAAPCRRIHKIPPPDSDPSFYTQLEIETRKDEK
jgi:hypothetical protein